jgi:hypothetical protein
VDIEHATETGRLDMDDARRADVSSDWGLAAVSAIRPSRLTIAVRHRTSEARVTRLAATTEPMPKNTPWRSAVPTRATFSSQ